MINFRLVISVSLFFLCLNNSVHATGGAYEMKVDLDGDGKMEKVAYDTAGLATYSSDGKLTLVERNMTNLWPKKYDTASSPATDDGYTDVTWEKWRWGRADAVVIVGTYCGSHCYINAWVIYQGPRDKPAVQMVTAGGRRSELIDADKDGYEDLVIWSQEIQGVGTKPAIKASQECLSEAGKGDLPYILTLDSVGDDFRCEPLPLTSPKFRQAQDIVTEWETTLSVLVQRMKSVIRQSRKARDASKEINECEKAIKNIESLLAMLYGEAVEDD